MARVDLRAPRKTALPTFKKYHRPHQKIVHKSIKRRNQASVFDHLALTSFHTFSLSLRRGRKIKPQTVEQDRYRERGQDRRWLHHVLIMSHNDPMHPSKEEQQAFIALTKLPTDKEMYTALTEDKVLGRVKVMYARLLRERARARRKQGIKHYRDYVGDWWVPYNPKMRTIEPKTMRPKTITHKEWILAQQAKIRANVLGTGGAEIKAKVLGTGVAEMKAKVVGTGAAEMKAKAERMRKVVADQWATKSHDKVDWEKPRGEKPQEKGKSWQIFDIDMPLRGPRI